MPRKTSPLKNWVAVDEIPKRQASSKAREECAALFEAFIGSGETLMVTTLPADEAKRQLTKMRSALKAMPEYADRVKVGKSGDKIYMQRIGEE